MPEQGSFIDSKLLHSLTRSSSHAGRRSLKNSRQITSKSRSLVQHNSAFQASAATLQALQRHSEASERHLYLMGRSRCSPGQSDAPTAASSAALSILHCLPYELPRLAAAAIFTDAAELPYPILQLLFAKQQRC